MVKDIYEMMDEIAKWIQEFRKETGIDIEGIDVRPGHYCYIDLLEGLPKVCERYGMEVKEDDWYYDTVDVNHNGIIFSEMINDYKDEIGEN